MTEKRCIGCGAILQNNDSQALGYVPDLSMDYCQRCFRLSHYDKHENYSDITANQDLSALESLEGVFVWIVDVIDLETSFNSLFTEFFRHRDFMVLVNKCDLLPKTVTAAKIENYVMGRLEKLGLHPVNILVRGKDRSFREEFIGLLESQQKAIIFTGIANVGKSTVINELLGQQILTVNRNPSTTLSVNRIEAEFAVLYDTVGLVAGESVQSYLASNALKKVVPNSRINPVIYQLTGSQCLSIGGLARIDIHNCQNVTAVLYCSNLLNIHRSKQENADSLWQKHYKKELTPVLKGVGRFESMKKTEYEFSSEKKDICIAGLGWLCITGEYSSIDVYTGKKIGVYDRKGLI